MIYRLLLSGILVFNCTFIIAMRNAIEDHKKLLARLRENCKILESLHEAQLDYYKEKVKTLQKSLADQTQQIQKMPEIIILYQQTLRSVRKSLLNTARVYKEYLDPESNTSSKDYFEISLPYFKQQKEKLLNTYLTDHPLKKIFIVHSDFSKLCKKIEEIRPEIGFYSSHSQLATQEQFSTILDTFADQLTSITEVEHP